MITNEHSKIEPNGFFERTFNWNVNAISGGMNKSGYIVQKITRATSASEKFWSYHCNRKPFEHEYYEAWKLLNGIIQYHKDYQTPYDDRWIYKGLLPNLNSMLRDCSEKYITEGNVSMCGKVFWIDETDKRTIIIRDRFKPNIIPWAGELPAAETFKELDDDEKVFEHRFESSWDFMTENKFIDAIVNMYCERNISLQQTLADLKAYFSELPVYEKLCSTFKEINGEA